jgi:hypothetical protein
VPDPRSTSWRASASRRRSSRPASPSSTSPASCAAPPRARASATSSSPTSARSTRWPCAALLRGRRHHPCRGPHRPGGRRRDHRDRADARRPREPGEAVVTSRRRPRAATRRPRIQAAPSCQRRSLLNEGKPARTVKTHRAEDEKAWRMLQLLTSKPVLYVCNVSEAERGDRQRASPAVERWRRRKAPPSSSRRDRERDRQLRAEERARSSWKRWASRSPASTG